MNQDIIVVATRNRGKAAEIADLLAGRPIRVMSLADFGPMPEAVENAETFEDNAYLKARHYARVLGLPCLADDSGLTVEALGGAPGVYSARYAGENADDAARCAKLLGEMAEKTDRRAAFVCALVLAAPSGPGLTWLGRVEGEILREPSGDNGFGYDPVFFYPPLNRTFAQLTREEKNQVSHRGRALADFILELDKVLVWVRQRLAEARPPHSCQH